MYIFFESDLAIPIKVNLGEMPVKLVGADLLLWDSEVVSQKSSKFLLLEGGALVLVISKENWLEVLSYEFLQLGIHRQIKLFAAWIHMKMIAPDGYLRDSHLTLR